MANIVTNTTAQVSTKNLENARNIKLSTNTHKLILCRAMINDVYDTLIEVVSDAYGNQQEDEILEPFRNAYIEVDNEVCNLISQFIETTSISGAYGQGAFIEM